MMMMISPHNTRPSVNTMAESILTILCHVVSIAKSKKEQPRRTPKRFFGKTILRTLSVPRWPDTSPILSSCHCAARTERAYCEKQHRRYSLIFGFVVVHVVRCLPVFRICSEHAAARLSRTHGAVACTNTVWHTTLQWRTGRSTSAGDSFTAIVSLRADWLHAQ